MTEPEPGNLPPPSGPAYDLPAPEAVRDNEWHRQSPRMLLVQPLRVLWSMLVPLLIAFLGVSRADNDWWLDAMPFVVVGLGLLSLLPWFTTRYQFTDVQLRVRTGLLNKKEKTAPLDRVRSVDVEAPPLHRILGLAKAKVGTGVDSDRVELDGLTKEQADELRAYLLRRSQVTGPTGEPLPAPAPAGEPVAGPVPPGPTGSGPAVPPGAPGIPADQELARIDWSWLRFAPFSLSSLVIVAGVFGVFFQFGGDLGVVSQDRVESSYEWLVAQAVLLLVAAIVLVLVVGWLVLSTLNYVIQWWNLRLVREPTGTIRLTRGLLTTTSTSVEEARVRGVRMTEPALLRTVRGGELYALATGVGAGGTTKLLPPCPRTVAESVGHDVLGTEGPLTVPVRSHGPQAHRRMLVQSQWWTLFVLLGTGVAAWFFEWETWIPAAVTGAVAVLALLGAELAYRHLGHAVTPEHLVSRTGAFQRERVVLERAGIIGWTIEQTFFMRRRGLAHLTATTAAGPELVRVSNIPYPWAVALVREVTPQVADQFMTHAEG